MYGIYINCKARPFVDYILVGAKPDETRSRNVFARIVGERVAIIETGKGCAAIRGYATIESCRTVFYDDVDARKSAKIFGTPYDIKPGAKKIFYRLSDVVQCKPYPVPCEKVNHGRSYTEFFDQGREYLYNPVHASESPGAG